MGQQARKSGGSCKLSLSYYAAATVNYMGPRLTKKRMALLQI